eukprot:752276-Hanusia_phi.AAC.5
MTSDRRVMRREVGHLLARSACRRAERDETIKSNASLIAALRSEIAGRTATRGGEGERTSDALDAERDKLLLAQEATIAKLKEQIVEKS